jgi:hypothetical protein
VQRSVQKRPGADEAPGVTVRTKPAMRLIGDAQVIASLLGGAGFETATSAECISASRRKIAPVEHSPGPPYACPRGKRCVVHRAQTARPRVQIAAATPIPERVRYSVTGAGIRDNPTDTTPRDSKRSLRVRATFGGWSSRALRFGADVRFSQKTCGPFCRDFRLPPRRPDMR